MVTVPEAGWAGKPNGELLTLAHGHYDVFVTIDQNLLAQQAVGPATPSVLVLRTRSNRYEDICPLILDIVTALQTIGQGKLVRIGDRGTSLKPGDRIVK